MMPVIEFQLSARDGGLHVYSAGSLHVGVDRGGALVGIVVGSPNDLAGGYRPNQHARKPAEPSPMADAARALHTYSIEYRGVAEDETCRWVCGCASPER